MARVKVEGQVSGAEGAAEGAAATGDAQHPPPQRRASSSTSGSKKYDVRVHAGLRDRVDERFYGVARDVFAGNVRRFAACPGQASARFSVEHILDGSFESGE